MHVSRYACAVTASVLHISHTATEAHPLACTNVALVNHSIGLNWDRRACSVVRSLHELGVSTIVEVRVGRNTCNHHAVDFFECLKTCTRGGLDYSCVEWTELENTETPDEAVIQTLSAKQIEGVIVMSGFDHLPKYADLLTTSLGLVGNDAGLSDARRHKLQMQERLKQQGLRSLDTFEAQSAEEAREYCRHSRFPVILKPALAGGCIGVSLCRDVQQIEVAFKQLPFENPVDSKPVNSLLIQEYVEGTEFVVNAVSRDGEHKITDMWISEKKHQPGMAYVRQRLVNSSADYTTVADFACAALDALGFENGPSHSEVIQEVDGSVALIELNARFHGSQPRTVGAVGYTSIDAVASAYAQPQEFAKLPKHYSANQEVTAAFLVSPQTGCLNKRVMAEITEIPSFQYFEFASNSPIEADWEHLEQSISDHPEWIAVPETNMEQQGGNPLEVRTHVSIRGGPWSVQQTTDMLSSPATVVLMAADKRQLEADYQRLRKLETMLYLPPVNLQCYMHLGWYNWRQWRGDKLAEYPASCKRWHEFTIAVRNGSYLHHSKDTTVGVKAPRAEKLQKTEGMVGPNQARYFSDFSHDAFIKASGLGRRITMVQVANANANNKQAETCQVYPQVSISEEMFARYLREKNVEKNVEIRCSPPTRE